MYLAQDFTMLVQPAAGDFLDPEFELWEEVFVEVVRPVLASVDQRPHRPLVAVAGGLQRLVLPDDLVQLKGIASRDWHCTELLSS